MQLLKLSILFTLIALSTQAQSITLQNKANQYDFVIITINDFVPICEQFAKHKKNTKGFETLVITKNQILEEFNDSTSTQGNIHDFIRFAGTEWKTPQPKYFMFAADIDSIPNYRFEVFPNTEFFDTVKSDYFYGINNSKTPIYSIGRISARTKEELSNYFNKVINYEKDNAVYEWNNNALYLADDGKESSSASYSVFEQIAFSVSALTPNYINSKYYFQSDTSKYFGTTDSLITYLNNAGTSSVFFCGNGNDTIFTHEALFSIDDVSKLTNEDKPFFASFTHTQTFSDEKHSSILDQLLFANGGTLLGVAPVGAAYLHANGTINSNLWRKLYTGNSVGSIMNETFSVTGNALERQKYNLFGDPTIVLKYNSPADTKPTEPYLPEEFTLSQNYPNPFNPTTKIAYSIPVNGLKVILSVYNILGQKVMELVNSTQAAGNYEVEFDASNLSSGTYIYRLTAGGFIKTNKMILIK